MTLSELNQSIQNLIDKFGIDFLGTDVRQFQVSINLAPEDNDLNNVTIHLNDQVIIIE